MSFTKSVAVTSLFKVTSRSEVKDFDAIYIEHAGVVRSVIYQIAGASQLDDLVQETFVKIWKSLSDFDDRSKIRTWIYRIATNVAIDYLRSARRKRETFEENFESLVDPIQSADISLSNHQLVQMGLQNLSDDHRTVLVLAYLHEIPISEIAEALKISEGTVKSRLHYARDAFAKFLQSKGARL